MTLQGTRVLTDNDGWEVERRMRWISCLPEYEGHHVDVIPVMSEQTGLVGGYQIAHDYDCPGCTEEERTALREPDPRWGLVGRLDARPLPASIHLVAMLGPDLPHLIAAIEGLPDDGSWLRRERMLDKFRGLTGG